MMNKLLYVTVFIIILFIWGFYFSKPHTCTISYWNEFHSYWKLMKYSDNCFSDNKIMNKNNLYSQDYCIYKNLEKKHWKEELSKLIFFEKRFIFSDLIYKRESFLENKNCSE